MVESGVLAALSIFLHFGMGGASQVTAVIKNPPANAGEVRDEGSIPGLGRYPAGGQGTHSSILARKIAWT